MTLKHLVTTLLFLTIGLSAVALTGCSKEAESGSKKLTIAVIPSGSTDVYWQYVHAGALQAGKKLGVDIDFQGPVLDGDRNSQIQLIQNFIAEGVNGIVLAPCDQAALVPSVKQANAAHIPVVIMDSNLNGTPGKDFVSFVATDNFKAGEKAGNFMAKLLGGKGKVVVLRFIVGNISTINRAKGFEAAIAKYPGITIIANQFGGSSPSLCQQKAQDMLPDIQKADGVFCVNEISTFGMLRALSQANLLGKKRFVGFDWQSNYAPAIKANELNGVVVQNPVHMGYMAVKYVVEHIKGKSVPATLDTGCVIVTPKNFATPAIQQLLVVPKIP
ncbi:MAG: substrate-binding domain-containing protein [Phycisphaerales bacterium]|nr:substrate-binding domain-containing protein [Phycisphaerales bacterium]